MYVACKHLTLNAETFAPGDEITATALEGLSPRKIQLLIETRRFTVAEGGKKRAFQKPALDHRGESTEQAPRTSTAAAKDPAGSRTALTAEQKAEAAQKRADAKAAADAKKAAAQAAKEAKAAKTGTAKKKK